MSISSISLTFFSMTGAAPAAAAVAPVPPASGAPVPAPHSCESGGRTQGRRNVLYEAMMAALREMGLTAGPAQPAPTPGAPAPGATPAPAAAAAEAPAPVVVAPSPAPVASGVVAPTEPATPPAARVEDAVFSFAHALWQALRGGESEGGRREHRHGGDDEGHHGHRRQGREHGHGEGYGMSRGYSGLATRLEALALRFDTGAGAANPVPVTPVAPQAGSAPPVVAPSPVAPPVGGGPAPVPAVPTPPSAASVSPLAQAFEAMMNVLRALNPNAPAPDAASPNLAAFLHSLARGLDTDRTTPMLSGIGIVINVSA